MNAAAAEHTLWRVFPWDARARPGEPFSPECPPLRQGRGRFDLVDLTPVLYFTETPEHAVGEVLQGYRGQVLDEGDLVRHGFPLALVSVTIAPALASGVVDLCDPQILAQLSCRPDELASLDRAKTQGIARRVWDCGAPGLRWWSALSGDWHDVIFFGRRASTGALTWGTPELLTLESPVLAAVGHMLGIRL